MHPREHTPRSCEQSTISDPGPVIEIGALEVEAGEPFPRLFAFDLFHHDHVAAAHAGPGDRRLEIVHSHDCWAPRSPVRSRVRAEALARRRRPRERSGTRDPR